MNHTFLLLPITTPISSYPTPSTAGLEAFRKFLQTEFSDENIEFWLACEEYKTLNTEVLTSRAQKIFEDYVTIQAPREVGCFGYSVCV